MNPHCCTIKGESKKVKKNIQGFSGVFWGGHGLNPTGIGLLDIPIKHYMAGKVSITVVELTLNLLTGPPGSHSSVPCSKAFGVVRIMTPVNFRVLEVSVTEVAEGGEGIG